MKTVEFRIPLPMSVNEYSLAQLWSVNEQSRRETGGGEGVEILKNEPFDDMSFLDGKYTQGQYTHKIYHIETKMPKLVRTLLKPIVGKNGFQLHEEAWNAYPYCKTVLTNPNYMKDNFKVILETLHLPDNGNTDNVLGLPDAEYAKIVKQPLNIATDVSGFTNESVQPATYRSIKTGRGPLDPKTWLDKSQPIMCCYKFVTVHFKWFGIQSKMESILLEQYRKMLLGFHQQIWCWTDEWYGLSLEEIRKQEEMAQEDLKRMMKEDAKRGTQMDE